MDDQERLEAIEAEWPVNDHLDADFRTRMRFDEDIRKIHMYALSDWAKKLPGGWMKDYCNREATRKINVRNQKEALRLQQIAIGLTSLLSLFAVPSHS